MMAYAKLRDLELPVEMDMNACFRSELPKITQMQSLFVGGNDWGNF